MTNIADHLPHLIILNQTFPTGHSAHTDAIFDDPFELAVRVLLNFGRAKVRYWRRHISGERHTGCMPIEAVTNLAVMSEVVASILYSGTIVRNGVVPILAADYYLLAFLNDLLLHATRLTCFAASQIECD